MTEANEQPEPSFREQSEQLRTDVRARMPDGLRADIDAMIEELGRSHVGQVIEVGEVAPDFTLRAAQDGSEHSLSATVARGPAVVSFYRGEW